MRYSPSTNGFFPDDTSYISLPDDVIMITDSLYRELLTGQMQGKVITPNGSEPPFLSDQVIDYIAQSIAEKARLRVIADAEIVWRQDAVDAEIATNDETASLAEWKKYRVLLMRIDTSKAPNIEWPRPPAP